MAKISVVEKLTKEDVLIVGLSKVGNKLAIHSGDLAMDTQSLLSALADLGATGSRDEVIKLPGNKTKLILFTGLGEGATFSDETLRRAAGAASRALPGEKVALFALPHSTESGLTAICEGAALGAYTFHEFRGSTKSEKKPGLDSVHVLVSTALSLSQGKKIAAHSEVIARYTYLVRDLINTPPSHLTPASFAARFVAEVKRAGGASSHLKITVMDEKALKTKGYGGITGVGQGSVNPPRLVHITYNPPKAKKRYAYVGKGITFDTGGLALKPALGMEAMKSDMSGAAAVCAAVLAIASLKLPVAIDAWAPLAENMVSDTAQRPSDIVTIYGGKTVEVLNPDAEGRLVLADALVKAQESKLDGIIDIATLTGAQVVALGTRTSAAMTNDDEFRARFLRASDSTGEAFWPMPLPEELRASLDSPVADLANIGDRMGGMLVAGLFLKDFIEPQMPWLHLDIAGPAYNEKKAHGYTPVGGTGVGLRSLVAFAESAS